MITNFKRQIENKYPIIGTIITLPVPEIVEILTLAGFDWLFIDAEHSSLGIKNVQNLVQTAGKQIHSLVRVPEISETWIGKCLDMGPAGIIVPNIRSASQLDTLIQFYEYPPIGHRSVGISRAQGYGSDFDEYIKNHNHHTVLVIQIENIDAVNNIEKILNNPFIDAIFFGPYDLSASMGKIGKPYDQEVQDAIFTVKKLADKKNVPSGIFINSISEAKNYIKHNFNFVAVDIDILMLTKIAKETNLKWKSVFQKT